MSNSRWARWAAFSNAELLELWEGLTMDDGIRYMPANACADDEPVYTMVCELETMLRMRAIWKPELGTTRRERSSS